MHDALLGFRDGIDGQVAVSRVNSYPSYQRRTGECKKRVSWIKKLGNGLCLEWRERGEKGEGLWWMIKFDMLLKSQDYFVSWFHAALLLVLWHFALEHSTFIRSSGTYNPSKNVLVDGMSLWCILKSFLHKIFFCNRITTNTLTRV